ncbi:unnamed protein product [Peronospora farinosa]|uniref:Uncharacterized protein n=1 Tax=Peronospora farinosa TaxID=134698 RepID=A0ABN8C4W6_9STRA|nr:unnamed protein product [Peronospora farinosa]
MVQWKFVYGLAALSVVGLIKGSPMQEDDQLDENTRNDECISLGAEDFTGAGKEISGKPITVPCAPGGFQSAPPSRRRLEVSASVDIKKLEAYFGTKLETDLTKLSSKCARHPTPWPSGYWPAYADSINFLWNKKTNISASEKYAKAFGHDVKTFMDEVSSTRGIDYMMKMKKKPCTTRADCKEVGDDSFCGIRAGKKKGYCIPKWPGICHAWAPASILEPEPICPVEHNGVVFEPFDIKALITMTYDGSKIPTIFTGRRFSGNDTRDNGKDQYGRFLDGNRRDISPGYFHIAATNILCGFQYSFIIDISAGNEVWNQPVSSFEITRMSWMTPTDAAKKYFKVDKYPFNDAATNMAIVTSRLTWIAETGENGPIVSTSKINKYKTTAEYEYILELDDTYQILGGEWLGLSSENHPDFLWIPTRKPDDALVTPVGLVYAEIKKLLTKSIQGDCQSTSTDTQKPETNERANPVAPPSSNASPTEGPAASINVPLTTQPHSETPTGVSSAEAPTDAPTEASPAEAPSSENSTSSEDFPSSEDLPSSEASPSPENSPSPEAPSVETSPAEMPLAGTPPTT